MTAAEDRDGTVSGDTRWSDDGGAGGRSPAPPVPVAAARFDWPEQTFASEVARAQDGDTILFRVTTPVTRGALQEWDGPFDFKFFERTDGPTSFVSGGSMADSAAADHEPDEWEIECPRCGQVMAECSCPREDADDDDA